MAEKADPFDSEDQEEQQEGLKEHPRVDYNTFWLIWTIESIEILVIMWLILFIAVHDPTVHYGTPMVVALVSDALVIAFGWQSISKSSVAYCDSLQFVHWETVLPKGFEELAENGTKLSDLPWELQEQERWVGVRFHEIDVPPAQVVEFVMGILDDKTILSTLGMLGDYQYLNRQIMEAKYSLQKELETPST